MNAPTLSRPLDAGEKFFWLLDHVSCMNFVVFAELDGQLQAPELQAALARVQQRHPLLNCTIRTDASGQLAFCPAEPAKISLHVSTVTAETWQQPLQAQLAQPFTSEEHPLLRALYLPRNDADACIVALCYHHSIADGRSGTALLREILIDALTGQTTEAAAHAEPAPMHALFPEAFDWPRHPEKMMDIYGEMKNDIKRHGKPADLPWLEQQQTAREPRFIRVELDQQQATALQQRCREQHTTIHGALGAAQLLAKRQALAMGGTAAMTLSHPVDMRPYLSEPVPEDGLGLYITMLSANYPVDADGDFWALARDVVGDIRRQLQRGDGHLLFTLLRTQAVQPTSEGLQAFGNIMLASPKGSMISNIGRVSPLPQAPQVRSISFALCPMPYQALFTAASSYNGRLLLNINYDAAKLAPAMATQLADAIRQYLLQAATTH